MLLTGENRRTERETCPSSTLRNTNGTRGANTGLTRREAGTYLPELWYSPEKSIYTSATVKSNSQISYSEE
jgi:hypothetical protein